MSLGRPPHLTVSNAFIELHKRDGTDTTNVLLTLITCSLVDELDLSILQTEKVQD